MEWENIFDNVPVIDIEEQNMINEYARFKKLITENSKDQATKKVFIGTANSIATIRNRSFRIEEQNKIKDENNWEKIVSILKKMIDPNQSDEKDENYNELERYINDNIQVEGDSTPKAATLRLAASVLPDYLTSIASESDIDALLKYLKDNKLIDENTYCDKKKKTSFEKSHFLRQTISEKYNEYRNKKGTCHSLPWKLLEFFRGKDFTEIEASLRYNQNIILTGAPGTGKTYLAKKVASYMITGNSDFEHLGKDDITKFEKQCEFVQFHPSYDYTDFVEGLRPIQDVTMNQIVFERRNGIFKDFCKNAVKEISKANEENKEPEPFVFIIDEINRGEISKIFGELFFSIDPGYRGEKGKVNTQYQNLIPSEIVKENGQEEQNTDPFRNGFYVPENVYIIGTMNDIDRSVESMDFAFRRRFAFYDVKACSDMLNTMDNVDIDKIEKLKNRMTNLNNKIISEKKYGLSSAYQIGGAYFKKFENYYEKQKDPFAALWDNHLKGLLYEYFRGLPKNEIDEYIKELNDAYEDETKHEEKK